MQIVKEKQNVRYECGLEILSVLSSLVWEATFVRLASVTHQLLETFLRNKFEKYNRSPKANLSQQAILTYSNYTNLMNRLLVCVNLPRINFSAGGFHGIALWWGLAQINVPLLEASHKWSDTEADWLVGWKTNSWSSRLGWWCERLIAHEFTHTKDAVKRISLISLSLADVGPM